MMFDSEVCESNTLFAITTDPGSANNIQKVCYEQWRRTNINVCYKYSYTIPENTWQCKSSCQLGQYLCPAASTSDHCMSCKGSNYSKCLMHVSSVQLSFVQCLYCQVSCSITANLLWPSCLDETVFVFKFGSPFLTLGSFPTPTTAVSASKVGVSYLRYRVQAVSHSLKEAWARPVFIVFICSGYASKTTFHGLLGMYYVCRCF
jgi:hypothetical protein